MKWTIIMTTGEEYPFEMPESNIGDRSLAFVCPFCLYVWAAIKCEKPWQPIFDIEHASCEDCNVTNYGTEIPGSLLSRSLFQNGWDDDLLFYLPLPLLKRELELHLRIYDRDQHTFERIFGA